MPNLTIKALRHGHADVDVDFFDLKMNRGKSLLYCKFCVINYFLMHSPSTKKNICIDAFKSIFSYINMYCQM